MKPRRPRGQAQILPATDVSIRRETQYVANRANRRDPRIVTLGPLVLFSTETGDAWMLDPQDHLAVALARDGTPLPVEIEETEQRFAIGWTHTYVIEDTAMIVIDRSGNAKMMWGYPTLEIEQAIRRVDG